MERVVGGARRRIVSAGIAPLGVERRSADDPIVQGAVKCLLLGDRAATHDRGPRHGRGIPQGSPISPLLANLYMRRFVLGWEKLGLRQSLGSRIVTYADDLVSKQQFFHLDRRLLGVPPRA
jgi:hypothetical protein